jgi:glycosyltransferase involved in cell wall biosynthesis
MISSMLRSKSSKTCLLTSAHDPTITDDRIYKECRSLVQAGYEVCLIAPHSKDDAILGIPVAAVPKPTSRLSRLTRTLPGVYAEALRQRAEIYHFHDPELIPVGFLLKLHGKRIIYDVREDFPLDILTRHWIKSWLRTPIAKLIGIAEFVGALVFDGILAATPSIAQRFPRPKTATVQNFPIVDTRVCSTSYQERPPNLVFFGFINALRGVREAVEAMAYLPESLGARFLIAGTFSPPELEAEMRKRPSWNQVEFVGFQSRNGLSDLLARARVGIVTLHPVPAYLEAQPIKLFEYMAAALPVVASNLPRMKEIVEEVGCGLVVDPLKPEEIAEAIRWLLDHPSEAEAMGMRGREAVLRIYNWHIQAGRMLALYRRICDDGVRSVN